MKKLSIVTPVFNEIGNLPEFIDRISEALSPFEANLSWELLFCVDPSTDGTEAFIEEKSRENNRIKMIRFSRRFGQPTATLAGIHFSSGDAVVVIDADLQDPPEVIAEMLPLWIHGAKIVLARRRTRTGEPAIKKLVSSLGYKFLNRFAEVPIPENTGDFRLMDRQVVNELKKFPEGNSFLRGLIALVGFETVTVEFDRPERFAGATKYNQWFGSLKIGFNGVVGYSTALLKLSTVLGTVSSLFAVAIAIGYAIAKVIGVEFPIGNPTVVVAVLLMGGLNLLSLGVIGLYVSRIYEEVKGRPKYIVERTVGFADGN